MGRGLIALFVGALFAPSFTFAAVTPFFSDEVTGTGAASRTAVDALDDAWRTAVSTDSLCATDIETGSILSGELPIIFDYDGVEAQVELLDLDGGGYFGGTLASTQGLQASGTSTTMQDSSPKPATLYDAGESYYNETSGSNSSLNALLITFSEPLSAFGSFFGDVETRTDGSGTTAYVRFFDADGVQIGSDEPIEPMPSDPNFDQSQCGAPVNNSFRGCGNRATRWIGFTADPSTLVQHMMVIVGDDDASDGSDDGLSEHLSMIGASTCVPRDYDLTITKTDAADPVMVGEQISYTITVTNNDTTQEVRDVVVVDDFDEGATTLVSVTPEQGVCGAPSSTDVACELGAIAAGDSVSINVTVATDSVGTTINEVSVAASGINTSPSDDGASQETVIINPSASVALVKSIDEVTSSQGENDQYTDVGDEIVYIFEITNTGQSHLQIATDAISDVKLSGVVCPETAALAPGASIVCTADPYVITEADIAVGGVENTAAATAVPVDDQGVILLGVRPVSDVSDTGTDETASIVTNPEDTESVNTLGIITNSEIDTGNDPTSYLFVPIPGDVDEVVPTPVPDNEDPAQEYEEKCSDGEIGNRVWLDLDSDGVDDDEPGLSGVTIKLKDKDGDTIDKDKTSGYGKYKFKELDEGEYIVVVDADDIVGYTQTYDPNGAEINNKARVTLECDEDERDIDFGFQKDDQKSERPQRLAKTGGQRSWIEFLAFYVAKL